MADIEGFLNSRNLVGFQLDGTHLHAVLLRLIHDQRTQHQELNGLARRVDGIESAVGELQDFARRMDQVFGSVGSAEEMRNLATQVRQLERKLDETVVGDLRELRRSVDSVEKRSANAAQLADVAATNLAQTGDAITALRRDLGLLSENQRAFAGDLRDSVGRVEEWHRTRSVEKQRVDDSLRDVLARMERVERDALAKLAAEIDDINRRNDENFKSVEVAVRQFEDESRRAKADIGNLRAELNALDNDASHRLNKIKEDADSKFAMLLQLMQNFERNNQLFEAHMAEAGRALQNPRSASRPGSEAPTPFRGASRSGYTFSQAGDYAGSTRGRTDPEI
jgi:chromosome segregation ATPase